MTEKSTAGKENYGDFAPAFGDFTDTVLFDQAWQRPELSQRDRSLITISSLIVLYRHHELPYHVKLGLQNGLTKEEIVETVTHLAFYAGWPVANTAITVLRKAFAEVE